MHQSIRSFTIPQAAPWKLELLKISLFKFPPPTNLEQKLPPNGSPNIEQFSVSSTNVVKLSLVLVSGAAVRFFYCKYHFAISGAPDNMKIVFLIHSITTADSLPLNSYIKACVLSWKDLTLPVQMPHPTQARFKCP